MRKKYQCLFFALLGLAPAGNAQLTRYQENYKVGYRDAQDGVIVPAMYDAGSDMTEGFAVVMRGSERGYIDVRGREVITCRYQDASPFVHGLACVEQNGKWGFINTKGEWAIPPFFDNAFSFKNGLARVLTHGKWGMINEQGEMKIPAVYASLYDASEGLIAASLDGRQYGYINASGKTVIDFRFKLSQPFDESTRRAVVYLADGAYFINTHGEVLEKVPRRKEEEEREERGRGKRDR
jgi:hypothetical protein